jgi:hypothetical protein
MTLLMHIAIAVIRAATTASISNMLYIHAFLEHGR